MISDFAHDIEARNEVRADLEKAIADYLAAGRNITQYDPEPEPEPIRAAWMNNSRRAKMMEAHEKRRKKANPCGVSLSEEQAAHIYDCTGAWAHVERTQAA